MSKNVQFVKNEGVTCSSNLHSKFHKVYNSEKTGNRRRIETEAKAKVVVSVWGSKDEVNIFFQIDRSKTSCAARK